MKKSIFSLLFILAIFASCKKDPKFSEQVTGLWVSTYVEVGGIDATATNTITLTIESSQEFDAEITTAAVIGALVTTVYTGDWTADEEKQELNFNYDNGQKEKYDVTELTETTMKANVVVDGVRRVFIFEKVTEG